MSVVVGGCHGRDRIRSSGLISFSQDRIPRGRGIDRSGGISTIRGSRVFLAWFLRELRPRVTSLRRLRSVSNSLRRIAPDHSGTGGRSLLLHSGPGGPRKILFGTTHGLPAARFEFVWRPTTTRRSTSPRGRSSITRSARRSRRRSGPAAHASRDLHGQPFAVHRQEVARAVRDPHAQEDHRHHRTEPPHRRGPQPPRRPRRCLREDQGLNPTGSPPFEGHGGPDFVPHPGHVRRPLASILRAATRTDSKGTRCRPSRTPPSSAARSA